MQLRAIHSARPRLTSTYCSHRHRHRHRGRVERCRCMHTFYSILTSVRFTTAGVRDLSTECAVVHPCMMHHGRSGSTHVPATIRGIIYLYLYLYLSDGTCTGSNITVTRSLLLGSGFPGVSRTLVWAFDRVLYMES